MIQKLVAGLREPGTIDITVGGDPVNLQRFEIAVPGIVHFASGSLLSSRTAPRRSEERHEAWITGRETQKNPETRAS